MSTVTTERRSPLRQSLFTSTTSAPPPAAPPAPAVRRLPLVVASIVTAGLVSYTWYAHGTEPGVLLLLGVGLGFTLFHSRFGFTSAWRQLVAVGNGTGVRAHALLLALTATLFAILIGTSTAVFGNVPTPSAGPLGVGLVVGAFLFGLGMQLGGSCASGTLFAVGSGQTSILYTLIGFIVGSTLAEWQYGLWQNMPALHPVLFSNFAGWPGSLAITFALIAVMVVASRVVQARRNPPPVQAVPTVRGGPRAVRGSWPILVGAVVLAVLGGAVMLVSGGAWGITSAFGLWGSKLVGAFGGHPANWGYWQGAKSQAQINGPILTDKTSLTDIGIILGAAIASASAGAFVIHRRVPWRTIVAAVLGGMLMGIGARLASGCNIGAYLAGVASGSLSGWVWGLAALAGTWFGLRGRALFGQANPKPGDGFC